MMDNAADVVLNASPGSSLAFSRRPSLTFGRRTQDYRKIVRKVVYEREVRDAITALQQRLNMLELMKEDVQDLIKKRKQRLTTSKTTLYVESLMNHCVPIMVVLFSLVLILYAGQWVMHLRRWK